MGVPYCIVKNKSRLGLMVRKKKTTCIAVTDVRIRVLPLLSWMDIFFNDEICSENS